MAKPRVLVTSTLIKPQDEADRLLQDAGIETAFHPPRGTHSEEELIALLQGAEGAIAGQDRFTARVLEAAGSLKVISRTGVGYDAIDLPAATARGVAVCTTPGTNKMAVAEYAFALMLACSRRLPENLSEVQAGVWRRHEGQDLFGSTLGILGLGSIGREVALRARAFGMRVLAYDLVRDEPFAAEHQVEYAPLEQLLRESDFVTLHLFLDERSRHLINAERLALMKPTAYLINTARGGIVDAEALARALREKRIAGAALDVFETEPLPADSPLRGLENVYLSAHVAAITRQTNHATALMAAENAIRVLRGERPTYVVNPDSLRTRSDLAS
jgi:phosphoglycerate dehydrogenase-like enzyme